MTIPSECIEITKNKKIVFKENKSQIIFENQNSLKVEKIKVDGCAIKEGIKCDYMIKIAKLDLEIYIELKGKDIDHALKQLETTIKKLSENYLKKTKICFIISTRCPSMTAKIQNFKKKFKKNYNARLTIKNLNCSYKLIVDK